MGIVVDAISGGDIAGVVKNNIDKPLDLSGKSCQEFFDGVRAFAGSTKITVLRIWSHGATHYADKYETPYNKGNIHLGRDQIDADTIGKYEDHLKILTPLLEEFGWVELRGCQAALGSGAKMMLRMADIWKRDVHGSDRSQPLMTWTPPVKSAKPGLSTLVGANFVEYNDQRFRRR